MPRLQPPRQVQRGISLIEAVVALAVMGVGTLAMLGVQSTLRFNSDVSRQRGEAVRIAQEALEAARRFDTLASYATLVDAGPQPVPGLATNTVFQLRRAVLEPGGLHDERLKRVAVTVEWTDRAGQPQAVRLSSALHGMPPALAGSLVLPTDTGAVRTPRQRHAAIPPEAVVQADGRSSRFTPPGAPAGVAWVFDHVSGDITQRCVDAACTPLDARLLAGFVRFATAVSVPAAADAALPPGTLMPAQVQVTLNPAPAIAAECYARDAFGARAYHCAVPVTDGKWSGRADVAGIGPLAENLADARSDHYRVCRYTPYRDDRAVGSGLPPMRNDQHPRSYVNVGGPLVGQNFLVIRAGHAGLANDCPGDDATLPVNTNTWHHQPPA